MSRSIDRVTTFHLGNRDEISHMNGLQSSSRLPSHPGNRDHMKRPLGALQHKCVDVYLNGRS